MNSFVKENATLVLALALPIIFAVFFYLSKGGANDNADPPKYDFVIVDNNSRDGFDFDVINGNINVTFTYQQVRENGRPYNVKQPNLYYIDADTMIAEPISVPIPADANNPSEKVQGQRITLEVAKFRGKDFNAASISPDGFELSNNRTYRDGNIMTEIFSGHRRNPNGLVLYKDGARFDIRGIDRYYGFDVVGWVMDETE